MEPTTGLEMPQAEIPGQFVHIGNHQQQPLKKAVYVVVSAPASSGPCTAPARPAFDCISTTLTVVLKKL
ncbi:hypothetical protein [Petroclostridium sp. X23]|uniref:hypothetical protein n=1 Tax=Petroclostridium sp. X23 TaxID=3045146 RepID=UPI0024AD5054|nr:hypothetical protein [Petroclostridium sp. X23]WHH61128.1 hypothetical protein QKW49_10645 [Petroclostridium sp. X23]